VALVSGGLGEHEDFGAGTGEADLIAGERRQVVGQAAEAAVGLPGLVILAGGLGLGFGSAAGGGGGVGAGGWV